MCHPNHIVSGAYPISSFCTEQHAQYFCRNTPCLMNLNNLAPLSALEIVFKRSGCPEKDLKPFLLFVELEYTVTMQ